jgi:hypothetical protein
MRPKARGLAHHVGLPAGAAQMQADGISSCCYVINNKCTQPSVMSCVRQEGIGWYSSRSMPSL